MNVPPTDPGLVSLGNRRRINTVAGSYDLMDQEQQQLRLPIKKRRISMEFSHLDDFTNLFGERKVPSIKINRRLSSAVASTSHSRKSSSGSTSFSLLDSSSAIEAAAISPSSSFSSSLNGSGYPSSSSTSALGGTTTDEDVSITKPDLPGLNQSSKGAAYNKKKCPSVGTKRQNRKPSLKTSKTAPTGGASDVVGKGKSTSLKRYVGNKSANTAASVAAAAAILQQQDKRFTGVKGETRCSATTTRGRACMYLAAGGTDFCFLHASRQETSSSTKASRVGSPSTIVLSPPTGKTGSSSKRSGKVTASRSSSPKTSNSPSSTGGASTDEDSLLDCPKSPATKRRTTAKLKQMHAASPFPLLSMISTDQWADRSVRVATGPFEGRVGIVQKWGNGWVSVDIPSVGMHNRRSFELYLNDDDSSTRELLLKSPNPLLRCVSRGSAAHVGECNNNGVSSLTVTCRKKQRSNSMVIGGTGPKTPRRRQSSTSTANTSSNVTSPAKVTPMVSEKSLCPPIRCGSDGKMMASLDKLQLPGTYDDSSTTAKFSMRCETMPKPTGITSSSGSAPSMLIENTTTDS